MSDYMVVGADLKKLANHHFTINGRRSSFKIHAPTTGWPRSGLEAYALLVDCHDPTAGVIPSLFKIFKADVPERDQRTNHLIQVGQSPHHHWLLAGMPYTGVRGALNGVNIIGHIARRILGANRVPGEDISRLRASGRWKTLTPQQRVRLAGDLCTAVAILEKLKMVHGDISPKNVIVGCAPDGAPAAILCDFDGFHHPDLPLLPRFDVKNNPLRPLGSPGFQYPALLERMAVADPDVHVETDRFALAAIVCEIMAWSETHAVAMERDEMLTDEMIRNRDLSPLPAELRSGWPAGFGLLARALNAQSPDQMPAPVDWMAALGLPPTPDMMLGFKGRPQIDIRRRVGNTPVQPVCRVTLTSEAGTFQKVDPTLDKIGFTLSNQATLSLQIQWTAPVWMKRAGGFVVVGHGPQKVHVQPGDVLLTHQWEFEFLQSGQPA